MFLFLTNLSNIAFTDIHHSPWSNENITSKFLPGVGPTTHTSTSPPNLHEANQGSLKSNSPNTSRTHHGTRSHGINTISALPPTSGHMAGCRDQHLEQTAQRRKYPPSSNSSGGPISSSSDSGFTPTCPNHCGNPSPHNLQAEFGNALGKQPYSPARKAGLQGFTDTFNSIPSPKDPTPRPSLQQVLSKRNGYESILPPG